MSKPLHERLAVVGKLASLFVATMLVVLVGSLLIQDINNAKPMEWSSPSEDDKDGEAFKKWWEGADFKPPDFPQQPAFGPTSQPQPWTPVTPGQDPVHDSDKPAAPKAPRTILP
jgi:hypothetical protein